MMDLRSQRSTILLILPRAFDDVDTPLYSLVGACKVLDKSSSLLEDVLTKVSTTLNSEAHTLTPWAWAKAQAKN